MKRTYHSINAAVELVRVASIHRSDVDEPVVVPSPMLP